MMNKLLISSRFFALFLLLGIGIYTYYNSPKPNNQTSKARNLTSPKDKTKPNCCVSHIPARFPVK